MGGSIGDLRFEHWSDGSAVVFLVPKPENEALQRAPRLPLEPMFQRVLTWFARVGVAVTVLAVAGLVLGVSMIAHGETASGGVVTTGFTLLAVLGGFLAFAAVINRVLRRRRGHHVKLDPELAASFELSLAQVRKALGAAPERGDITAAQQMLWKEACELQRRAAGRD